MRDQEISLNLLLWRIVKAWRVWVPITIVFSIMVPWLQYASAVAGYKQALRVYEEGIQEDGEQYDNMSIDSFTREEQLQLEDANRVKDLLDENRKYAREAVSMSINPYQENVMILTYCVDTHYVANYNEEVGQNYTSTILSALSSYAASGLDQSEVWSENSDVILEKHLGELVSSEVFSTGNNFSITVIYEDEETLHGVADNIKVLMNEKTKELSENISDFDLILVSEDYEIREDYNLASKQQSVQNTIYNYDTSLTNLVSSMTDDQLDYFERVTSKTEGNIEIADEEMDIPIKPTPHMKYVIVGAMLGIFLAVLLIALQYIFSGKLHSTLELAEIFSMRQFGVICLSSQMRGIDRIIDKLKNCRRKRMSEEDTLRLAISNAILYCKKENIHQLFVTGTEIEKMPKDWINKIFEYCREHEISVICGENLNYDAASLENAVKLENVLLIEQAEVALTWEIEQEIRTLQNQGVNLVGYIGIE